MGSGGTLHRVYSVVVFVILAALDNVAIGIVPPLYGSIADELSVGEGHIALATTAMFLISAVAAIGFAYVGDRTDRKPVLVAGTVIWVAGTAWSGARATSRDPTTGSVERIHTSARGF